MMPRLIADSISTWTSMLNWSSNRTLTRFCIRRWSAMSMDKNARIYVAGHRGLVGSAILDEFRARGFTHAFGRTRAELNLLDQQAVEHFFDKERPACVILAAARVGGIKANDNFPATF